MKSFIQITFVMITCVLVISAGADTFTHKTDGTTFNGFATQKVTGNKTLVFNSEDNKMAPLVLSNYDVVYNTLGRRDYIILIQVGEPEILLSKVISEKLAASIVHASNTGPQAIIVQIDSPGGRGDYMKIVTSALSETKNCPTVAYIPGGSYGGAYSAASILAIACDKIFIGPNAGIGAVGLAAGQYRTPDSYGNFLRTYCSDSLVTYATYAASLAQIGGRPSLIAQALLDKRLSVVEVANVDGSRQYISKNNRLNTQTLLRTLTEGVSKSVSSANSKGVSPIDIAGKVLNLTAQDAVELGLADKVVSNIPEILAEAGIENAEIRPDKGISSIVKKFQAGRRNIEQGLRRIDLMEEQVDSYYEQFSAIDTQLRLATQTREIGTSNGIYSSRRDRQRFPSNYTYYYDQETPASTRERRDRLADQTLSDVQQRITREEPAMDIGIVYNQLITSYRDLVAEYRRVLNLVKRWPGGLPPELTVEKLQSSMDSASNELDKLYRYQPIYPTNNQQYPASRRNR